MTKCCTTDCSDSEALTRSTQTLKEFADIEERALFYKLFAHTSRLKILAIMQKGELCVCDIAASIELSIPATSQQLKMLHEAKILQKRNSGTAVYYGCFSDEMKEKARTLLYEV